MRLSFGFLVTLTIVVSLHACQRSDEDVGVELVEVVDGVHTPTGLVFAEGFTAVRDNCINCHSAQLITQTRATREGWAEMIRWMQAKQGLGPLGSSEPIILDYLAAYYAPVDVGRRAGLDSVRWYLLEL